MELLQLQQLEQLLLLSGNILHGNEETSRIDLPLEQCIRLADCPCRSITPFSLYTPHTGVMRYQDNITKIPTAAVTIEDAELMARMQARGTKAVVHLYMEAQTLPP